MASVYVAGKYRGKWTENAMYYMRASGARLIYNWMVDLRPSKPYLGEGKEANGQAAYDMIKAAWDCDTFVLVVEDNLYGAMAELGAALASRNAGRYDKKIIVTFPPGSSNRESIFFAYDGIEIMEWADFLGSLTTVKD